MSFRMSSIQFMTNYKASLNKTYREQAKILEQGDGSSIHRGSDDPIGYSKLLRYTVSDNENDQYQKNVDTAISWMKTSDNAASNISDRMKTFSEKTVEAANSYLSEADSKSIAKEMFSQIEEIVAVANTQQGDRYIFAGQKDTTEPYVLSHDTYQRGISKTLDAKQAAFFKGASGDINSTLYQFLTIDYTDPDTGLTGTYYLDTISGYVYTKEFVDEGYKELLAQGYTSITETDKISETAQKLEKTYAVGYISTKSLIDAWETVNSASEAALLDVIRGEAADSHKELKEALKIIYDNDYGTVVTNLSNAKSSVVASFKDVPEDELMYNYTFKVDSDSYPDYIIKVHTIRTVESKSGEYSVGDAKQELADLVAKYPTDTVIVPSTDPATPATLIDYKVTSTQGTELTGVSWSTYDSETGVINTDVKVAEIGGSDWNTNSTYKNKVIENIITAVDEYALQGLYSDVANDDDSTDFLPNSSGTDLDSTAKADNIAKNILETVKSTYPDYDLASEVTSTQMDTLARSELVYLAMGKAQDYGVEKFLVAHAFNNQGIIRDDVTSEEDSYITYETQTNGKLKVTGINVRLYNVDEKHNVTEIVDEVTGRPEPVKFTFATIDQKVVKYLGDDNYISMVKMNGANDKSSDIVNLHGNDLFGCDIFDDQYSGNTQSGCAMLNNMLTVYTFTDACDEKWLDSDGVTLSDVAHSTVTIAETTLGSRLNLYDSVSEMLDNQKVTITNDITNVSGTDIAELATRLMEITTLYNMSLSLGGRVLPQSLADYL